MNDDIINSPKRLAWLDYAKTIAIVFVVLFHSGLVTNKFTAPILAMCIPLFFTTNGALVLNKDRELEYYLKRILKLFFLYFFWGVVPFLIHMAIEGEVPNVLTALKVTLELRMGYAHGLWFLCTLITLYFIYTVIQKPIRNPKNLYFLIIVSFLFSFKLFGYSIPTMHIPNILANWESECVFCAICGFAIIRTPIKINTVLLLLSFIILYFLQQLMYSDIPFFNKHTPDSVDEAVFSLYKSPLVLFMTVILFQFLKQANLTRNRFIEFVGSNTLGIYVTHGSFLGLVRQTSLFNNPFTDKLFVFLFGLSMSLFLCYLFSKSKYTRFLISLS